MTLDGHSLLPFAVLGKSTAAEDADEKGEKNEEL
jgi:hypothetical protein